MTARAIAAVAEQNLEQLSRPALLLSSGVTVHVGVLSANQSLAILRVLSGVDMGDLGALQEAVEGKQVLAVVTQLVQELTPKVVGELLSVVTSSDTINGDNVSLTDLAHIVKALIDHNDPRDLLALFPQAPSAPISRPSKPSSARKRS